MQLDHVLAAGALVQPVDVLGDEGERGHQPPQPRDRVVPFVRLHLTHLLPAHPVPAPDAIRVAGEGLGRGQVLGPKLGPETGQRVPEGGDAALGRDPGAGQRRHPLRFTEGAHGRWGKAAARRGHFSGRPGSSSQVSGSMPRPSATRLM